MPKREDCCAGQLRSLANHTSEGLHPSVPLVVQLRPAPRQCSWLVGRFNPITEFAPPRGKLRGTSHIGQYLKMKSRWFYLVFRVLSTGSNPFCSTISPLNYGFWTCCPSEGQRGPNCANSKPRESI